MQGRRHILLLGLGLCLVASYVNSASIKVFGSDPNNPYEDVTRELDKQRADRQKLETLLEQTTDLKQQDRIQKDLDKIHSAIAKMEVTFRVIYKDHIEAIKDKTKDFESEKTKMQNELQEAEEQHAKVVAEMEASNQKDKEQIASYQAQLEESAKQIEKIQRELEALKELQAEKEEKQKEEKEQLDKVKSELTEKLEEAQRLHTKAFEVMAMSLESPESKEVDIPLRNEIKEWKHEVVALARMTDTERKLTGLFNAQQTLKALQKKLLEKSELTPYGTFQDLEEALDVMKMNTKATRTEQLNQRNALLEKLKQKTLGDYNEDEVNELQKINTEVHASDLFLKEISRRRAYLKSMKDIDSIMTYCRNVARRA